MICLVEVFDGNTEQMSVILGALIIFLVMVVIGLVVKIRKLHTGADVVLSKLQMQNFLFD